MLRVATPGSLASELTAKWQYLCLAELCNACGNCTTFCPEQGEPFLVKPRLFLHPARFAKEEGTAYLVRAAAAGSGPLAVESRGTTPVDVARLEAVINDEVGLPLRAEDITSAFATG
jgi:putative selenate reductase